MAISLQSRRLRIQNTRAGIGAQAGGDRDDAGEMASAADREEQAALGEQAAGIRCARD